MDNKSLEAAYDPFRQRTFIKIRRGHHVLASFPFEHPDDCLEAGLQLVTVAFNAGIRSGNPPSCINEPHLKHRPVHEIMHLITDYITNDLEQSETICQAITDTRQLACPISSDSDDDDDPFSSDSDDDDDDPPLPPPRPRKRQKLCCTPE